jgi:hypothetical protein
MTPAYDTLATITLARLSDRAAEAEQWHRERLVRLGAHADAVAHPGTGRGGWLRQLALRLARV